MTLTRLRGLLADGATVEAAALALGAGRAIRELACRYVLDHTAGIVWRCAPIAPPDEEWAGVSGPAEGLLLWQTSGRCAARGGTYRVRPRSGRFFWWPDTAPVKPSDAVEWEAVWPGLHSPARYYRAVRESVTGLWCCAHEADRATAIAMRARQTDLFGASLAPQETP